MIVPVPENEDRRLRTLRLYRILDTAAEKTLDDLTRLAATICETPISLISLVDKDRQWFKSRVGLEATETPREMAFCAHAIVNPGDLLIVEDAAEDERFAENPLVTRDPLIRFYAGAPLVMADETALGTLCVIDRRPRHLTEYQKETLKILSRAIVTQLELRRAQEDLRAIESLLPMCAWCRNIKNEGGNWQSLHDFVTESVPVTHGICPECAKEFSFKLKPAE